MQMKNRMLPYGQAGVLPAGENASIKFARTGTSAAVAFFKINGLSIG